MKESYTVPLGCSCRRCAAGCALQHVNEKEITLEYVALLQRLFLLVLAFVWPYWELGFPTLSSNVKDSGNFWCNTSKSVGACSQPFWILRVNLTFVHVDFALLLLYFHCSLWYGGWFNQSIFRPNIHRSQRQLFSVSTAALGATATTYSYLGYLCDVGYLACCYHVCAKFPCLHPK